MNQPTGHDLPEQGDHGISHQCIHLIISQTTYNLLTGRYRTEQLPPVTVKGKKEGLMIYRLIS